MLAAEPAGWRAPMDPASPVVAVRASQAAREDVE
jgi:hypothetical protein